MFSLAGNLPSALAQDVAAPPRPTGPASVKPDGPVEQLHTDLAYKLAGDDYFKVTATLQCRPAGVGTPNTPETAIPPTRVFDNLYYVGLAGVGAWAVKTSKGIILIDALNNKKDGEETIEAGLKKLGLDPAQIKIIVITHAHGDHYGAATYLKEKYGAAVMMGAADWDFLARPPRPGARPPSPNFGPAPQRELDIVDGQKFTLGDTTLTFVLTPGHTPGTVSVLIPVKDKGTPHMVALWGGTGMPQTVEERRQYLKSIDHFLSYAVPARVDVEISNHAFVDDGLRRMEVLRARKPGQPHPFVIGPEAFGRFMGVLEQCTKVNIARLGG